MTGRDTARAADALARKIQRAADKNRRVAGFTVPFLAADPDAGDPTTMWAFMDNRLRIRRPDGVVVQVALTAAGATTSSVALPTQTDVEMHTEIYAAMWGRSFCDLHGTETGSALGYGYSTAHTRRRIMVGFDQATIATDLSGAVVRSAELSLVNLDATTDPVTITFGVHNQTSAPASYSAVRRNVWAAEWPRTGSGEEWRTPEGAQLIRVAEWLRDGTVKGLTVEQPDTGGPAGELSWETARLRITYTS